MLPGQAQALGPHPKDPSVSSATSFRIQAESGHWGSVDSVGFGVRTLGFVPGPDKTAVWLWSRWSLSSELQTSQL